MSEGNKTVGTKEEYEKRVCYTACKARHIKRIEGKAYRENSYRRIGL